MAGFNVAAGLSQMGETVARVTGLAALEQQKSGLEIERLKLANDLAMQRESVGRKEQHGLNMETLGKQQTFTAGENKLNRESEERRTATSAGASIRSAEIGLESTKLQIAARSAENDKTIAAQLKLANQIKINEDGTASLISTADGTSKKLVGEDNQPLKFQNPDKAKAQADLITTTRDQLNNLSRQYESDLRQAQQEYQVASKSLAAQTDPAKDPELQAAKKRIEDVKKQYEPRIQTLNQRINSIAAALAEASKISTPDNKSGGKSLSDFDRTPARSGGSGLIDNQ